MPAPPGRNAVASILQPRRLDRGRRLPMPAFPPLPARPPAAARGLPIAVHLSLGLLASELLVFFDAPPRPGRYDFSTSTHLSSSIFLARRKRFPIASSTIRYRILAESGHASAHNPNTRSCDSRELIPRGVDDDAHVPPPPLPRLLDDELPLRRAATLFRRARMYGCTSLQTEKIIDHTTLVQVTGTGEYAIQKHPGFRLRISFFQQKRVSRNLWERFQQHVDCSYSIFNQVPF